MPTNLLNRPCQIVHRSPSDTEDDYGNVIADHLVSATVCEFQQDARKEHDGTNDLSESKWRIFLPTGTDITSGDQVVVDGKTYEVDGEPESVRNPRTRTMSHLEVTVVRTAGGFEVAS
jgi:hypothetical protein